MPNFYCTSDDSDSEPVNLNLFSGKTFCFIGLSEKTEETVKKVSQQLGAKCNSLPDYIFTTTAYWNSHIKPFETVKDDYFKVAFIRDCVDANYFLDINKYRLNTSSLKKNMYATISEIDPCCGVFHGCRKSCSNCDPEKSRQEKKLIKQKKISVKEDLKPILDQPIKENHQVKVTTKTNLVQPKIVSQPINGPKARKNLWADWEKQQLLDYIVNNTNLENLKGPALYNRMVSEGYLSHRTPDALRYCFSSLILNSIETYNLPQPVMEKLKKLKSSIELRRQLAMQYNAKTNSKLINKKFNSSLLKKIHSKKKIVHNKPKPEI